MKAWIEIGDATNKIIEWIASGQYRDMMEATVGDTKDDGFRAACMLLPSVLMTKCEVTYECD